MTPAQLKEWWIPCDWCDGLEGYFANGEWVNCSACDGDGGWFGTEAEYEQYQAAHKEETV